MSNVVANIFRVPELRNKILFTMLVLIIYRIGAHIPIPGVNVDALKTFFDEAQGSGVFDFIDLFTGGALKRFTIFALGIMPYISASIILDLLKVVFPYLEQLSKEGQEGQKKINMYTKYGTVLLCVVQAIPFSIWMQSVKTRSGLSVVPDGSGIGFTLVAVLAITTGTMVLMWFGEMITERGIGNGISLLIFAGIVVRGPQAITQTVKKIGDTGEPIVGIILIGIFLVVIAASILLTLGVRRIPVQYGKKMAGATSIQRNSQYLPLKVNAAGVIPIIFASAIIMLPAQMVSMTGGTKYAWLAKLQFWLSHGHPVHIGLYVGLIIFFSFFYTSIKFKPTEMADNLQKYGGFIPGTRPGQNTSDYIMNVLNRITLPGSIFLALIAIVPDFILKIWPEQVSAQMAYIFGGTSLLIMVGVALDTLKQIESQLLMRHYDGFISNTRMKGR